MKGLFKVRYVGDDSLEHERLVWADGGRQAGEVVMEEADFVVDVRSVTGSYGVLFCGGVILLVGGILAAVRNLFG